MSKTSKHYQGRMWKMLTRKMKDSGIKWIGEIPEDWEIRKLKYILEERKEKNNPIVTDNILSLSVERGIFPYAEKTGGGNNSKSDLTAYKVAHPNDIVLNSMNILAGAVGLSRYTGAVSPVYYTLYTTSEEINITYYYYLFRTREFQRSLLGLGNGIMMRESSTGKLNTIRMRIPMDKLAGLFLPLPPRRVQDLIVKSLAKDIKVVNKLVNQTKQSIKELKKYKQSLIIEVVTKGLDPNAEMKDSGIEWIGMIPKHWTIKKVKYFLSESSVKNYPNETVLSLYRDYGVIPKDSRTDNHNVTSSDTSSYKLIEKNDVVINKMKAWQGSLGVSSFKGIISPAYYVYKIIDSDIYSNFLHYVLRNNLYLDEYRRISSGIRIGQWDLEKKEFEKLLYPFPNSTSEQQQIVQYLDKKIFTIDSLIEDKTKVIEELENYKKSLIYEYVTGKKEV